MVPLAVSHALGGNWSLAENQLSGLQRDPYGLRDVVTAAASLRRGNRSILEELAGSDPTLQNGLEQRAELLISASEGNARIRAE